MKKVLLAQIYRSIQTVLGGYARFYPIKIIHDYFLKYIRSNFSIVLGHKMFLDSKDSLDLFINGVFEELETKFVNKEIKRGDVVLDIGANIGYYTLIFAKLVGEDGKVFAFEPDPTNFTLLKKNVKINGYNNVILVQKAVSNKNEELKLFLNEDNKGDHRIYDSHDGRKFVEIESVTLDEYFKDYNGKIDFIKMDIQGAEGGALQGVYNLLKKNKHIKIISEFWPMGLKRFGIGPEEYLKLLIKLGFKMYEINEQEKKIKPVNIYKLLDVYAPLEKNYTNLLCMREK